MTERAIKWVQDAGTWLAVAGFAVLCLPPLVPSWRFAVTDAGAALVGIGMLAFLAAIAGSIAVDLVRWRAHRRRRRGP